MIFNILYFCSMFTCVLLLVSSCNKFENDEAKIVIEDIEKILEMQDEKLK